jgi:hypothetical protein
VAFRVGLIRKPPKGWVAEWIDSTTFFAADYRPRWLMTKFLAARYPAFVGGPSKSLKTMLLTDLAVSLGSGSRFLGQFEVPQRVRVGVLSGESGEFTLQETARRVCVARGTDPSALDVLWGFSLPQLANPAHVECLSSTLAENKVEVLILDPVYLALLAGNERGQQASNLMDIGPLLMRVTKACLDAGATPILVHHTRKNLADPYQPIELADLAFSGCAEFARQWLLINRREKFEPGSGKHQLWMGVGGSIGQRGLWAVDADEGELREDFTGRKWDVVVAKGGEAREKAKNAKQERKDKEEDGTLLAHMEHLRMPFGRHSCKLLGRMRLMDLRAWQITIQPDVRHPPTKVQLVTAGLGVGPPCSGPTPLFSCAAWCAPHGVRCGSHFRPSTHTLERIIDCIKPHHPTLKNFKKP